MTIWGVLPVRRGPSLALCLMLAGGLGACAGDDAAVRPVTETSGEDLFSLRSIGGNPGCITCHSLTPDHVIVGPPLAGLADRADDRIPGVGAAEYVRSSILRPDDHVIDGFDSGKMPDEFGDVLTSQQIDALVRYVLEVS